MWFIKSITVDAQELNINQTILAKKYDIFKKEENQEIVLQQRGKKTSKRN